MRKGAGEYRSIHRSGCAEIKEVGRAGFTPRATRPEAWDMLIGGPEIGVTTGLQTTPDAVSSVGHGTGPGLVDDEPGYPALSILAALRRPAKPATGLTGQGAPVCSAISPARSSGDEVAFTNNSRRRIPGSTEKNRRRPRKRVGVYS